MELAILIGLQASGKSTFYRERFAGTHVHASKDLIRNKNRERRQIRMIETALAEGRSVVVDNTNPTPEGRAPLIELGRAFGATVIGYYFESRVDDCLKRNQERDGDACVPNVAIFATIKKLQRPAYSEGFDRLFYVHIGGTGFDVADWQDDTESDDTE